MATINQQTLDFLFEYLQSNLKKTPDIAEVKSYLDNKLTERDIVTSYKKGIITSAEVTAFIQSHIYTQFILDDPERIFTTDKSLINSKLNNAIGDMLDGFGAKEIQ